MFTHNLSCYFRSSINVIGGIYSLSIKLQIRWIKGLGLIQINISSAIPPSVFIESFKARKKYFKQSWHISSFPLRVRKVPTPGNKHSDWETKMTLKNFAEQNDYQKIVRHREHFTLGSFFKALLFIALG